jgi:hypothetical protein
MVDVQQLQATRNSIAKGLAPSGPALPASTVDGTNNTGMDLRCRISAGTVTVVSVDGVVLGGVTTNEWFYVRAGSTFNITYSVAPTLQWFLI